MIAILFAIFTQLLDMLTTWWGLLHGFAEHNPHFGEHDLTRIVAVKLLLIIILTLAYFLLKKKYQANLMFWLLAAGSVSTFYIAMHNLSLEWT